MSSQHIRRPLNLPFYTQEHRGSWITWRRFKLAFWKRSVQFPPGSPTILTDVSRGFVAAPPICIRPLPSTSTTVHQPPAPYHWTLYNMNHRCTNLRFRKKAVLLLTRLGASFPSSLIRSSAVIQHTKSFPNTKTRLSKEDEGEKNKTINKMISKKTYPIYLHRFQQHRNPSA